MEKSEYSKFRKETLAHAFAYMNLIKHWKSGIPRVIDKVKVAGLREPEFIGGEVDLRINIYRGQVDGTVVDLNAPNTAVKSPIKCRQMNRNSKFISMYRKMPALQRHRL